MILKKPLITEKFTKLGEKYNQVGFVVDANSTKPEIKSAVEKMYGVEVERVNTSIVMGKRKSRYSKKGGFIHGKKSNIKKAIITLKEGQKIDFFENI